MVCRPELSIQHYKPSARFEKFIRQFIFLKQSAVGTSFLDKYIPDGYTSFVIHWGGNVYCYPHDEAVLLPRFFIVVPLHQALPIRVFPSCDTMVVSFHTTMFTRLFRINLSRMKEMPFLPGETIGCAQELKKIQVLDTNPQRIAFIEEWLSRKFDIENYEPDEIDQVFDELMGFHGSVAIRSVLQLKHIDSRTFRRKFLQRTGMNAKSFCRIARFHYLWSEFLAQGIVNTQEMIYNAGFYDQSHMINDFKQFIGESPKNFFTRDQELVRFMSGKNV